MTPDIVAPIKALLLPPGCILLLLLATGLLYGRFRRLAASLFIVALVAMYVFSTPIFARWLAATIEPDSALILKPPADTVGHAIVVLGRGRYVQPPEYLLDDVSECGLVRLRYAAEIHDVLQLPVLISGGRVFPGGRAESGIMARILERRFAVRSHWRENKSRNTIENARYSAEILHDNDITTIYLVTHALHMRRAGWLFEQQGFRVIKAPTYFYSAGDGGGWLNWLPSAHSLLVVNMVFKEYLGILWQTVFLADMDNNRT